MNLFLVNLLLHDGDKYIVTSQPGQMVRDSWRHYGCRVNSITPIRMDAFFKIVCTDKIGQEEVVPVYGTQDSEYFKERYQSKGCYKSVVKHKITKDEWINIMKAKASYDWKRLFT